MKSLVLSRGDNIHGNRNDIRIQTRPSGDLEIVEVSSFVIEMGERVEGPHDKIIGVIERDKIPTLAEFLLQHQLDHQI